MFSLQKLIQKLKPETTFLFLSIFFGLLFIVFTPPLQVPDEPNHFYRAWQISEGTFTSVKENNRIGGTLPTALKTFSDFFYGLIWFGPTFKYDDLQVHELLNNKESKHERKFLDFNNTALYSPVCYLPASVGIFILRQFTLPILYIFYGARLFNLLFWIVMVFLTIKKLPVYKWLFCFMALLPMSLFINASLSADVVTNGICYFFMGTVFGYIINKESISNKQLFSLFCLVFLLVSVKTVYAPLTLLLILIPKYKFGSRKSYYIKITELMLFGLAVAFYYSHAIGNLYLSYDSYNPDFRDVSAMFRGADMKQQLNFMKTQDWYGVDAIFSSITNAFPAYFYEFIGVFGWLNLPLPHWLAYVLFTLLVIVAVNDNSPVISLLISHKLYFVIVFYVILFLIFLSQYLTWTHVGSSFIEGIQGRYLIPFFPLLLVPLYRSGSPNKLIVPLLVCVGSTFPLVYSLILIHGKYFN